MQISKDIGYVIRHPDTKLYYHAVHGFKFMHALAATIYLSFKHAEDAAINANMDKAHIHMVTAYIEPM